MVRLSYKPPRLPAALMIVSAAIFTCTSLRLAAEPLVQQSPGTKITKHNARPGESSHTGEAKSNDPRSDTAQATYFYEFSQPEFFIRHIVIEHNEKGAGKITFERKDEETSIVEPVEISPAVWARILSHWQALRFLDSDTEYQADKQFPHLGTMRLSMTQGARRRTTEFNWSNNSNASALVNEYRKVADQAIAVFDISVARENQPLNTPKLMEHLESLMKRNWLSDPQQLIPLLKEISIDEHLPLIARNHAARLLKKLEK
jgi:hypothetical protein